MNRPARTSALLGGLLLWSAPLLAQETSDLDALLSESVSTTSSKSAQASTGAPALSVNVTAEDLRRYGIRTLGEAYNFLALGMVSEDPLSDLEVGSRGVLLTNDAGKHVLLMIDGHVTNDQRNGASYHGQAAGIPIELIDHIEIVLGPGSVLYGSNAMLGVVNVVTKKAKDYEGVHLIAEGSLSPAVNAAHQPKSPSLSANGLRDLGKSYRVGIGLGQSFKLLGQASELTGQLEYFAAAGPTFGWPMFHEGNTNYGPRSPIGSWGGQTHDSYYQQTPSGYVRIQSGDFQLTLHALTTHASAPYGRVQDSYRDFDDPVSYVDRRYGAFDLSWGKAVSGATSLSARVYGDASRQYSQNRGSAWQGCLGSQFNGCIHTSEGHGQWLGTELQTTIGWLADRSMSSMFGVEGRVRAVEFQSGIRDFRTAAPSYASEPYHSTGANAAVYAQQVYSPTSAVTLNAGARLDIDDQFGQRVSPRAAAALEVWHGGTLKLIYSEAFRAPSPEELHLTNRFLVLAAPALLPETVRSTEALIQQRFGTHRLLFGVFRSWWDEMVLRARLSKAEFSAAQRAGLIDSGVTVVFQFRNAARVDDFGYNASYEATALEGRLSYGANLTSAYSRVDTPQGPKLMTVTPSIYGNARVSYDLAHGYPTVGLAAQMSGKRLADNGQDPGITQLHYAPPTLDTRLTLTGEVPALKNLQYRVMADYAFTTTNPYQGISADSQLNHEELVPVNRVTALAGLQYDFK